MIPTISCQEIDHKALNAACRDWGFFVLKDHDIDPSLIEAGLSATALFFQQPLEEKNKIRRSAANCWGYNDAELTKNKRDWKEILDIGPAINEGPLRGAKPQWPGVPGIRATLSQLSGPPRYRSINWGDFRAQRSAGDYADLGSEIQISDFSIGEEHPNA